MSKTDGIDRFHTQGKPLCPEEKQLLVSVKPYFDRNKTEFGSRESAAQMTANALGIGLATVNQVMAYQKGFVEKWLPNLPKESIIVMDNASYLNVRAEYSAPTPTCSKKKIHTWLETTKIPCKDDCLKVEFR